MEEFLSSPGGFITPFNDKAPSIHRDAFVDVSARVIGDVSVGPGASIWPGAVVRADSAPIRIGKRAAVLDLVLIEAPEGLAVEIEDEALVSHGALIHGARICTHALVGIGAIILDGAVVSTGSIIGAGSLVAPGTEIPPHSLIMGVPGKRIRETTAEERLNMGRQIEGLFRKSRSYMAMSRT